MATNALCSFRHNTGLNPLQRKPDMKMLVARIGILLVTSIALAQLAVSAPVEPRQAVAPSSETVGAGADVDGQKAQKPSPIFEPRWAYGTGIGVLVFGVLTMGMLVTLKNRNKLDSDLFFKLVALTLVLTCGLSLIVIGYGQDQIASMMGLLGTIAGYILGQGTRSIGHDTPKSEKRL